jgi:long-chain acyl-CoA synthetase
MKFNLSAYTIDRFFAQVVERYSESLSIGTVDIPAMTYREMGERVDAFQQLLLGQGIGHGDRVAIVGVSTPEWAIAYTAAMALGVTAVPVMEDFPAEDILQLLAFAEVSGLIISSQMMDKLGIAGPAAERSGPDESGPDESAGFVLAAVRTVIRMEDSAVVSSRGAAPAVREEVREDDLAEILFTSGTTGFSKGVMLTHKNLVSNIFEGPDILQCIDTSSVVLSILPMAHAFGSTSAYLSIIYCGASLYFLGKKPTIAALMKAFAVVKPTILGSVPLIFEKIYAKKVAPLIAGKPLFRFLAAHGPSRRLLFRVIGKKFKQAFGGRLECAIIGGAALAEEVEDFLKIAGIPFALGYGMTEAAPLITFQSRERSKKGAVGWAVTDVEILIENPEPETGIGEILVRGPNVMQGYWKNPEATAEILSPDGWLRTGDRGYLDDEGFLFLKGRSKNVIVGPSGENIYPEVIESLLSASPLVDEALVYAENHKIIGRIFPNSDYINLKHAHESAGEWLERLRKEVNAKLPSASRIVQMIEEKVPFIKTASNKIKRAENIGAASGRSEESGLETK